MRISNSAKALLFGMCLAYSSNSECLFNTRAVFHRRRYLWQTKPISFI